MNCAGHGVPLKCVYASIESKWETRESSLSSSSPTQEHGALTVPQSRLCDICGHFHRQVLLPPHGEFPGTLPGCTLIKLAPLNLHLQDHSYAMAYTNLSNIDLFLLNHFITTTSHTLSLSSQPDSMHLWSQVIPTLIKAHPFLFHSALAITSAHLSHSLLGTNTGKSDEIRHMEEWHHAEAMKHLKMDLLNGIDEVNCHATFAGDIICILYLIHRSSRPYHREAAILTHGENHLDTAWVWFIRGAYGSVIGTWTCIRHGPVSTLIREYSHISRSTTKQLSKNTESMLSELTQLCINFNILGSQAAQEMVDVPTATAYYNAIYNLRMIWTFLESSCKATSSFPQNGKHKSYEPFCSAIIQSVLRIPAQFWDCMEAKRPRALIIYAYIVVCWEGVGYSAGDSNLDPISDGNDSSPGSNIGRWWTSGKAENDLNVIGELLDSLAVDGLEREVWKSWIAGAWRVFYGLKHGWWISTEGTSERLDVLGQTGEETSGSYYHQTLPANGSGTSEFADICPDSCMPNV